MIDKTTKTTGREEDYRDYEERDLAEGWPYADSVPGSEGKPGNGTYGRGDENFDEMGNPGFERAAGAVINTADGLDLFGEGTEADTEDDALEEQISDALSDSGIDMSAIDLKVRRGIALLTGAVETAQDRRRIELSISEMPGISDVRNRLTTRAVDSNIPDDWDD